MHKKLTISEHVLILCAIVVSVAFVCFAVRAHAEHKRQETENRLRVSYEIAHGLTREEADVFLSFAKLIHEHGAFDSIERSAGHYSLTLSYYKNYFSFSDLAVITTFYSYYGYSDSEYKTFLKSVNANYLQGILDKINESE